MAIPFRMPLSEDVRWSVTDLSTSVSSQVFTTLQRLAAGMEGAAPKVAVAVFVVVIMAETQPRLGVAGILRLCNNGKKTATKPPHSPVPPKAVAVQL